MLEVNLKGFRRKNGDIGIRNHIAIIAVTDNAIPIVSRTVCSLKGAIGITPNFGRGLLGKDSEQHKNTLIGLATNPNVFGAVIISLEEKSANYIAKRIAETGKPVESIAIEEVGGTIKATGLAAEYAVKMIVEASNQQREPLSLSELIIGVECGGSDGSSGLVSNPVTGLVSDKVIDNGGTVIMSETMEVLGAEHILAKRAKNKIVSEHLIDIVKFCVEYLTQLNTDAMDANPAPDNIKGGLSTIEEKALGAIKKGGSKVLQQVIGYGQRPTSKGFIFMDAPCEAVENMTALASGGCHAIIFSTGIGNTTGNPVSPTIKVSGNPNTIKNMQPNIDVDISEVITGKLTLDESATILYNNLIEVCMGKMTKSEILGEEVTAISRIALEL